MVIKFTPEQETKKIQYYCIEYYRNDDKKRVVTYVLKQRRIMLEFIERICKDKDFISLTIKIKEYEDKSIDS